MAKILIVDDSRTFRRILIDTLSKAGHEVIGDAGNGEEALNLLKGGSIPDILTLDITMPVMDGLVALKQIKSEFPGVKVVMVSAAGQKDKVMEALKLGASDFLQKPFKNDDVVDVIAKLL